MGRLSCQHGPLECQANKIHACAISKLTQADVQLRYATCMISDNMSPEEIGEQCAQEYSVQWKAIVECAGGREGDELLKHHGDLTNSLQPTISFVPTILLDQSDDNQPGILKNLFKEVCGVLQHKRMQLVPECH
ncbi:gamma-interferon-inducible lysosomal thiol reductase-like isoform X2 [Periplaneta americana]|uniref:gamma-interferon-inducible lysosomal thiol reductase-like isoform X2 n=1 Tax=Periplaneta americana TaxID=6978 RepID=UPI0037E82471